MSIYHNGKEYGATKVINYSAAPDYNRGVVVDNIQTGNYQATDNGFLMIQLQSQQSNPTKVSVIRSKTPITNTDTEIASIVISQYQYSETLVAQVMAREYYKLVIEGVGNPQVISCMFYPYASNVPIKLTESIGIEQVEGLESELAGKQDAGDYATNTELNDGLATKQDKGNYATNTELNDGLATKQDKGNYFNKDSDVATTKMGGTGRDDGLAKGIANDNDFFDIDNKGWVTGDEYNNLMKSWYATNYAQISLPSDYGVMIRGQNAHLKSALSFSPYHVSTYSWNDDKWKRLAFIDEIPTVLKYQNSDGIWTETKLSTGEVMLEGWGAGFNDTSNSVSITLPKTCVSIGNINSSTSIYGIVSGSCGFVGIGLTTEAFKGFCIERNSFVISAGAGKKLMGYTWQFRGILA